MEIPVIRMHDGDMHPSYEGWHGIEGDVYTTGGAIEGGGGGIAILLVFGGGNLRVVEAGGEVRGGGKVPRINLRDFMRDWRKRGLGNFWEPGEGGKLAGDCRFG